MIYSIDELINYVNSKCEGHCSYCKYQDDCHGITCYGGEPIEPPCCYNTPDNYLAFDIIIKEMEEREENYMNKVLKLYYDRKVGELDKKYAEKINNDFENIDVVKQYKKLIESFEKEQEELFKTIENFDNDYLIPSCDANLYKYTINENDIKLKLDKKYDNEHNEELDRLAEFRDEVDAQLSLSDDLNYQMEVLTRYDILDKKTNKVKA